MMAVDTSVVVAAFASWHEAHDACRIQVSRRPALPAPSAFESYSVLTRLPAPHRAPADVVSGFLSTNFPGPYLVMGSENIPALIRELADKSIVGGAVYDALVAAVVREAGATLLSLDRRAAPTYRQLGIAVEYLA